MSIAYIIYGPTGVGKTEFAIHLARRVDGEIISADSRQVYRGFRVATGTPPLRGKRYKGILHHCMQIADPLRVYSAFDFQQEARVYMTTAWEKGNTPIIVGGTAFWIRAVLENNPLGAVPPNPQLRRRVEVLFRREGVGALVRELDAIDPSVRQRIDCQNSRRLIRAIEIASAGTLRQSALPAPTQLPSPTCSWIRIGILCTPEELRERISARVMNMMRSGLVSETVRLLGTYVFHAKYSQKECAVEVRKPAVQKKLSRFFSTHPAFSGIGYEEITQLLAGIISREDAIEQIKTRTWQYAKRQLTWLRKEKGIGWITTDQAEQAGKDHLFLDDILRQIRR